MPDCLSLQFPLLGPSRPTMPRDDTRCVFRTSVHISSPRANNTFTSIGSTAVDVISRLHMCTTRKKSRYLNEIREKIQTFFLKATSGNPQRHLDRGSGELDADHVTCNGLSRQLQVAYARARARLYRVSRSIVTCRDA